MNIINVFFSHISKYILKIFLSEHSPDLPHAALAFGACTFVTLTTRQQTTAGDRGAVTTDDGGAEHTAVNTTDYVTETGLIKVLHPTQHKIGHFGDALPRQSLD